MDARPVQFGSPATLKTVSKPASEPASAYETRLAARRAVAARELDRYNQLGNARLGFVLLAIPSVWIAAGRGWSLPWMAGLAAAILIALFVAGDRLDRRVRRARRSVLYYERALERVRHRRNAAGETGERFADAAHPYAIDLDVFGSHSLFQLLSTCRTRAGEKRLAGWLLAPSGPDEIRSRHQAIEELRGRLDLREDIAVLGADFGASGHEDALAHWAVAPPVNIPPATRWIAAAFSVAGLIVLTALGLTLFEDPRLRIALILVALLEGAVFFRWRSAVNHIAASADEPGRGLALLRDLLARIECETLAAGLLASLQAALTTPREPSRAIARLTRLIELLDSRDNLLLRIVGPLVLWTTQVAFAVELWRQKHGHAIPEWLNAVAEFEALSSLAAASYEHPEDVLPEITAAETTFEAHALAHPLLEDCVPNDVSLDGQHRLLIVSGSNMSGKSTLLRTVGANAVLALAGAPVRARSLRISLFSVGASIRTTDSLEGGVSRFYAEILRIRKILDLDAPALFLLDELLAGTNSHDRRIGAEAILRSLLEKGNVGLATTHDLALSAIADTLPNSGNVHFEDFIADGKIHFDYRLRPGVVTHGNALELMRSVGLKV
jgi:hypothetical protein